MRIGIDGRALQGSRTGIGRYVYELCLQLQELLPNVEFFVYTNRHIEMPVIEKNWILRFEPNGFFKKIPSGMWVKYGCGRLVCDDNLDIFWGCTGFLPSLPATVKTIVTVYDFNYILVPKTMKLSHLWLHRLFFASDVKRADVVTAISNGTAEKVKKYIGCDVQAIVSPAVSDCFEPVHSDVADKIISKYGIERPYILAVATLEPRKNLPMLIEAYTELKQEGRLKGYQLVLVGKFAWQKTKIESALQKLNNGDVVVTGFVDDADLPAIYSASSLFVFPSVYEGFGMPVAEASKCGCKVLATDIPELHEAAFDGVIFCKPTLANLKEYINISLSTMSLIKSAQNKNRSWMDSAIKLAGAISKISVSGI